MLGDDEDGSLTTDRGDTLWFSSTAYVVAGGQDSWRFAMLGRRRMLLTMVR